MAHRPSGYPFRAGVLMPMVNGAYFRHRTDHGIEERRQLPVFLVLNIRGVNQKRKGCTCVTAFSYWFLYHLRNGFRL